MGPPQLEISISLAVPFLRRRERQLAWGRVLVCGVSWGSFSTVSSVP